LLVARLKTLKLALASLLVSLPALLALAVPAAALSAGSTNTAVLCEGDCSVLGPPPDGGEGVDFDFTLGLKPTVDGTHLTIDATGDVFIVGPIAARGDVWLKGLSVVLDADLTKLGDLSLDGGGQIQLGEGGSIVLAAALLDYGSDGGKEGPYDPFLKFQHDGDVYVDLSTIELSSLKVLSEGSIVVKDDPSTPVPEPSTALLFGLGLAALAIRRPAASTVLCE
jgi:hypothetical protein